MLETIKSCSMKRFTSHVFYIFLLVIVALIIPHTFIRCFYSAAKSTLRWKTARDKVLERGKLTFVSLSRVMTDPFSIFRRTRATSRSPQFNLPNLFFISFNWNPDCFGSNSKEDPEQQSSKLLYLGAPKRLSLWSRLSLYKNGRHDAMAIKCIENCLK